MREKLKELEEARATFIGTFERFGKKSGWNGYIETTVLLSDVKNAEGELVADHLWFNLTKGFEKLKMKPGQLIQFDARVKAYYKGYSGYREDVYRPIELDYKLSRPSKISILPKKDKGTT